MKTKTEKTIQIEIKATATKEGVIFPDLQSFQYVWGAASSPIDVKPVKRTGHGSFFISWEDISKRLQYLNEKVYRMNQSINTINQLLKEKE